MLKTGTINAKDENNVPVPNADEQCRDDVGQAERAGHAGDRKAIGDPGVRRRLRDKLEERSSCRWSGQSVDVRRGRRRRG